MAEHHERMVAAIVALRAEVKALRLEAELTSALTQATLLLLTPEAPIAFAESEQDLGLLPSSPFEDATSPNSSRVGL